MKMNVYIAMLMAFLATNLICITQSIKRRYNQQRPNNQYTQRPTTYEQQKEEDHQQVCNILGFASNIFGNFVQLVSAPNNRENVGQQVGNMAQNVYHIVAEATKSVQLCKSGATKSNILEYLQSDAFKEDLIKIVDKQLETIKN